MPKDKRGCDVGAKNAKNDRCRIPQNCNISDTTDSVEFAAEPLDTGCKKARTNRDDGCKR